MPHVTETPIPGLLLLELPVHGDNRGWFKENWQREKMIAAGLPDFGPVQHNISFNGAIGTTRGIHAEPWDKLVSVATGRIFGAWVDLRAGATFGTVFTAELDAARAIYIPRGVGNAYQTLEPDTAYSYLVNEHWSSSASYTFLNLADESIAVDWPIPLQDAELSDKDRSHPRLTAVAPLTPRRTLVLGAAGQLGTALRETIPTAEFATRDHVDLSDSGCFDHIHWPDYDVVINAAAYTAVDAAETAQGRAAAWAINVTATAALARIATEHRLTLIHISSDYVFDGTTAPHPETEPASPLNVYGQTKAAADAIISTVPRHYIVRTSWIIGEGANFVRTMASLAERGSSPSVVNDQVGRLTFASDLAAGIRHLISTRAAFGTYNVTNAGQPQSWAAIAQRIFELTGHDAARVTGVESAEYFATAQGAPRPLNSVLDLTKIEATGFRARDADVALREYLGRGGVRD
ncbi:bifunctional dTDP-4-dehydrorhamnose 3,5-epimerase family protein/NAD(P)-dependent oxidoreductase [Salinibacterium sp. SWN139]|uniref:sugar nucleotide-binding protein n=1 Tax=Salinibacterium sp. SWN139 TaxID=2792055 RepID=UPI0018CFAE35|nr:bifunctional dTDP-4-dehydrorhamnose 3,5-epimerase family protein/NAD(P)-dependent oxidoreductase [Salinibacterium sp. SWN139]MBH0052917.1 bifunctional dTDP-4-dehydrorhamnose 3,5-epimerase family protein/NAD(P)-dependent oxidoreductase [Salinibacterium sp. SWN139]